MSTTKVTTCNGLVQLADSPMEIPCGAVRPDGYAASKGWAAIDITGRDDRLDLCPSCVRLRLTPHVHES